MSHQICPKCGKVRANVDLPSVTELSASVNGLIEQVQRLGFIDGLRDLLLQMQNQLTQMVALAPATNTRTPAVPKLSADAQYLLNKEMTLWANQLRTTYDGVPEAPSILMTPEQSAQHRERQQTLTANRGKTREPFMTFDAPAVLLAE